MPDGWQRFATSPTDLFFPEGKGAVTPPWRAFIVSVCSECPVQADCLDHGIHHESEGWWGGVSPLTLSRRRRDLKISVVTPEVDAPTKKVMGTFIPPSHGTMERYRQHKREGEDPCEACMEAQHEYHKGYRQRAYAKWKATATPEQIEAKRADNRERNAQFHRPTPAFSSFAGFGGA